jgi:hypothetical protein
MKLFTQLSFKSIVACSCVTLLSTATSAMAEIALPKPSPKVSITQTVGLTDIGISYSSPGVKGREIWGELVPYGKVWRTGANECSKVSFSKDVSFADKEVTKGEYCLYTIPGEKEWVVILSSDTKLWGANGYDAKNNIAEAKVAPVKVAPVERLSISLKDVDNSSAKLSIVWDEVEVLTPIEVDTEKHALANINALGDDAKASDLTAAAQYLLGNTQDLSRAMKLVEQSIAKEKSWRNHWVKAQILKKQGQAAEAASTAKSALKLGDDSGGFRFYRPQIEQLAK